MQATTGEEFDPSYLRLIRDRLEGNVPGAAELAALPFGLSGAFDEELSRWPVMERRPLLLWFGVFALSSKAIRLEWAESVLRVFDPQLSVDTESWRSAFSQKFNSAEPGEYALYHERFGSFVLQSIGQADVERLNAAIIHCCREAMEGPVDSFGTRYALRHGADHHLLVAGWKQDAGALENWLLNEEVWSAQFRLEGNWAIAMEGCRTGLKTAAKLKDRQRLTQFAVALRQLTVRDEDCAEEALNLFREGCVEEAVQRVWNWDDDRLLIWVCLVLFDAKGLREDVTPRGGEIKAIHALFSLLETRCSNARANKVYPVDQLFGLLRWLGEYGLPVDWLLQRMSYTWDDLRDEFRDGHMDDLSIHFLVSALRAGKGDMLRPKGPFRMLSLRLVIGNSFKSGNDEVWQLFRDQMPLSLVVKFLSSHLQYVVSEGMKQQQLISLSRVHHWLAALELQQTDEPQILPLSSIEFEIRRQKRRLLQPEEAKDWLSVFQKVVELLLTTDRHDLADGTPDEKGRLVQMFLHDAGWGVLGRMATDAPLFKVLYEQCALASGNASPEQRETWSKLTASSWTQEEAEERLLNRNSFRQETTVQQAGPTEGNCNRILDPILQLEAIAQRCKEEYLRDVHQLEEFGFDAMESLNGEAVRHHSVLVKGIGPPACDVFAEYMMLAYAKAQEYSVSLGWVNRFTWSHRPELAWEVITKVPRAGSGWHAWKSEILGVGRRSIEDIPQTLSFQYKSGGRAGTTTDRAEAIRQCVDWVFRCGAFDEQDFVTTVLSGLAIGQCQVSEDNSNQAGLYVSKRTTESISMTSEEEEILILAEQYLSGDDVALNDWEGWISEHLAQLQTNACLRSVALMCFDLGRYDFCLALFEMFDVAEALSEKSDLSWERKFCSDDWRPIPEEMLRFPHFRTFLWHHVSSVQERRQKELLLQLWNTREGELEWGSDEFDQWKSRLDILPAPIQHHVVELIWVHIEAAAEVSKGLYAPPVMRGPAVRFSPKFWSLIISVSLRQNLDEKVNWLLFQMGIRGVDEKGNPIRREVSHRSNALDMLAGWVMSLSLTEPLTVSLVERVLKDSRFAGHFFLGSEVLLIEVSILSCWVEECGYLALNFAREMPVGGYRKSAMSAFFSPRRILENEDVLIAAKGLNVQDEGVVHVIPDVVMEGEEWENAMKWLAVSELNSVCLEGLIRALAFGERWEQVTSPETAMRTPGLEELVDLGDWGYA